MLIKNMHSILAELTRYSGASEQYLVTDRAWSWFSLNKVEQISLASPQNASSALKLTNTSSATNPSH